MCVRSVKKKKVPFSRIEFVIFFFFDRKKSICLKMASVVHPRLLLDVYRYVASGY